MIGFEGEVVRTKRGELSVKVGFWQVLAEARQNFGDKWAGISDFDMRYRHREADLWANPETRTSLTRRSQVLQSIRRNLWDQDFMEVETPMLNGIPTGAAARPFVTHHNALGAEFFLRIAPELWLKRLVVGGYERVFEMGRVFRNEGISPRHNPEFTMLELYVAYWDFEDMMTLTEELCAKVALDVLGTTEITYQGREFSFATGWPRRSMAELASEAVGQDVSVHTPRERLVELLNERDVQVHASWGPGRCLSELFEATSEADIWNPMFVTEHPLEISPLARGHRRDPMLSASRPLPRGANWPMVFPSSTTPTCSEPASKTRPAWQRPVMTRRCRSITTTSRRWSGVCHQRPVSALVLTAWPC